MSSVHGCILFFNWGLLACSPGVGTWSLSVLLFVVGRPLLTHHDSSHGRGGAALLRGLRVRMGMARGLTEHGVQLHQVTKRRLYPGAVSRHAHAVSEIGAGGQVSALVQVVVGAPGSPRHCFLGPAIQVVVAAPGSPTLVV